MMFLSAAMFQGMRVYLIRRAIKARRRPCFNCCGILGGRYRRLLFVPVDMPLIESGALRGLLEKEGSVYYEGYPLPACIVTGDKEDSARSVRELLESRGAQAISFLPAWEEGMANLNTQQEWERATQ